MAAPQEARIIPLAQNGESSISYDRIANSDLRDLLCLFDRKTAVRQWPITMQRANRILGKAPQLEGIKLDTICAIARQNNIIDFTKVRVNDYHTHFVEQDDARALAVFYWTYTQWGTKSIGLRDRVDRAIAILGEINLAEHIHYPSKQRDWSEAPDGAGSLAVPNIVHLVNWEEDNYEARDRGLPAGLGLARPNNNVPEENGISRFPSYEITEETDFNKVLDPELRDSLEEFVSYKYGKYNYPINLREAINIVGQFFELDSLDQKSMDEFIATQAQVVDIRKGYQARVGLNVLQVESFTPLVALAALAWQARIISERLNKTITFTARKKMENGRPAMDWNSVVLETKRNLGEHPLSEQINLPSHQ
ncbi:MAG: hypothetical protein HY429_04620 [Candidatus Levybacteria bacterium]|nr:hypothetical protein [Candidatus Levybacteria bacterium]